jgi:hypothetical protein
VNVPLDEGHGQPVSVALRVANAHFLAESGNVIWDVAFVPDPDHRSCDSCLVSHGVKAARFSDGIEEWVTLSRGWSVR